MNTLTILNRAVANRMTDEQRKAVFARLKGGMAQDEAKLKEYGVWGGTAAPAAATGAVIPLMKAIPSTKGMIRQQLSGTLAALRRQTRGAASGETLKRLGQELEVAKRYRRLPDVTHQEVQQFDRTIQRAYDLLRKAQKQSQQQAAAFAESRRLNDALRSDIQRIRSKDSVRVVNPLGNRLPPTNDPNERRRRAYWARVRGSGGYGAPTKVVNPKTPLPQGNAAPGQRTVMDIVSHQPRPQLSGFQQWLLTPGQNDKIDPPLAGDEYYNAKIVALYDQYRRDHPNDTNPPAEWLAAHPEWKPPASATPKPPHSSQLNPDGTSRFVAVTSAGSGNTAKNIYVQLSSAVATLQPRTGDRTVGTPVNPLTGRPYIDFDAWLNGTGTGSIRGPIGTSPRR